MMVTGTPANNSLALLADDPETFYILWNPASERPSRMVFNNEIAAWQVADEMARKAPGDKFFVMEAKGYSRTDEPVVRHKTTPTGTHSASLENKLKGKPSVRRK